MNFTRISARKCLTTSVSAAALLTAGSAYAQDADEPPCPPGQEEVNGNCVIQDDEPEGVSSNSGAADDVVDVTDTGASGERDPDAIVVTGSRIKRDSFNSISPLQVITTESSQSAGLFDPAQILQRSESAAGQQIDATFQGFVLDNGPGSQTINLRALGPDRTLLLINGRRYAPAGVEGAPTVPSINLLPSTLVDRYDLLLDGASSVYGSDAVAGVVNVILRKDFDGLELTANGNINPQGGGDDYTLSGAYGLNFDRGFIGIGAEYAFRDEIRLRDRDFFQGCDTNYEVDQNGNIYTLGRRDNALVLEDSGGTISISESPCKVSGIVGRIFNPFTRLGSIYFNGGEPGNIEGIPGFSESTDAFGDPVDRDGDGIRDVDFQDFNLNGADLNQIFVPQQKLYNIMAYGEYTLAGDANITPFFEFNYSRAEIRVRNDGPGQLFPSVPDLNAFNPCNIDLNTDGSPINPNGVDCRAADNDFNGLTGTPFALSTGFSTPVLPIVSIRGDRDNIDIRQDQYRGVLGVRGDLPFIAPSWNFEIAGVYSFADGRSVRRGIREDKLALAIGLDPTADYNGDGIVDGNGDGIADDYDQNEDFFGAFGDPQVIGACNIDALANPELAAPDLGSGCVPVNLFSPSVLGQVIGDLETQAERDYLFGVRSFDTTYEQIIFNAIVTGDLFELPAGPVGAAVGIEYRRDEINSDPNFVASNGLFFGFFTDNGAVGSKEIKEAFAELDIPLQAGKPLVQELTFNISGRVTDEEFYGTNFTYSIKGGWRPIEPLLLKFSYGTSFRAPNLRENFLQNQSGFLTLFDPCAVPDDAFEPLSEDGEGGYVAENDDRDPRILANCRREGRDPTRVGISDQGLNTTSLTGVEISTGGTFDLEPETSRSFTAGFAFEDTFGDGFDLSLGASYFDIKVKDSIIEPSSQFIINDCFARTDDERSVFCDRISTSDLATSRFLIDEIDSGFINLNEESVRGIDFNTFMGREVALFGTLVDFGWTVRANHLIERSTLFVDETGLRIRENFEGEFGLPRWTGTSQFTADIDKFRLTYSVFYTGSVEQDADDIDLFADAFGIGPDGLPAVNADGDQFFSDTCLGNGSADGVVAGDGLFCRDVGFADEQFLHTVSLRYRDAGWEFIAGVDNIFDTAPPLVDSNEVLAISNTAIGNGYDYDGREFFFQVKKEF